jgi:dTDP-4-dehydrorhamnose reductase
MNAKHILVTGSEGAVGRRVCPYLLSKGHHVRGFGLEENSTLEDYVCGDLASEEALIAASEGMDCVVHLAAYSNNHADFADVLLVPNVLGLHNVCEAARKVGVHRLILASSVQVIGEHYKSAELIGVDISAPINHYAVNKVLAEVMGEMYARHHGLSVVAVRLGFYPRSIKEYESCKDKDVMRMMYISHDDANRFFEMACVSETPAAGEYAVTFLMSGSDDGYKYDMGPAKVIGGFEPQDRWPEGLDFLKG